MAAGQTRGRAIARAALALPGGLGTLTEIMVAWNLAYIQRLQGEERLPVGVDAAWMELLRPHLEMSDRELALLAPISSPADLRVFLEKLV